MQIQILSVTPSQQPSKTPGKTFSQLEVAFKNLTFQGKVEGKKIMGFLEQKPAYDVLINAKSGEVYEVEIVKNNGYNNWVNATLSGAGAPAAPNVGNTAPTRAPQSIGTTPTAAPKSNYETPEERAKKQVYIVRQSSISNAIDLLSVGQKSPPDVDKVLEAASRFESFVFGETVKSDAEVASSFFPDSPKARNVELDDDIPF